MKKTVLAMTVFAALLAASPSMAQGRHRHHAATEQVAAHNDNAPDENVAYSDTTSTDGDEAADEDTLEEPVPSPSNSAIDDNQLSFRNYDNPFAWFVALFTAGIGGVVLALIIVLFVFLVMFGPFIILFMILRYLIRRHNDRVALVEKAMAAGVQVPEHMKPIDRQTDEYVWKRGVRNTSIGFGLTVMFMFLDANALVGVGVLMMCLGIGQMVIARTTGKKKDSNMPTDDSPADSAPDDDSNVNIH